MTKPRSYVTLHFEHGILISNLKQFNMNFNGNTSRDKMNRTNNRISWSRIDDEMGLDEQQQQQHNKDKKKETHVPAFEIQHENFPM